MVALYIGGRHGVLDFLKPVNDLVDIGSIFGSHTAIVTAGMLVGSLFTAKSTGLTSWKRIRSMTLFGAGLLLAGFLLRPLHGFSKIHGTESYCLATSGICCLLFLLFYVLMDVLRFRNWAVFLRPVGTNPLVAYILPALVNDLFDFASRLLRADVFRVFWPFFDRGGLAGILNAAVMTGVILFLTWALTRAKVIIKV
jgi:predicted acyltransferase